MFEINPVNPELEGVAKHSIESKVSFLHSHFEKIEDIFKEELDCLADECELESERTKDHEDDSQLDYRLSDSLREIEYIYLRMHRYSAILAAYSFLESSMNILCADFEKKMDISISVSDMSEKGLNRFKLYLKRYASVDFAEINPQWSNLKTLSKLRNCIMHADGNVEKMQGSSKLIVLINAHSDLSFIEKNQVMLSSEFVYKSIKDIKVALLYFVKCLSLKEI